MVYASRCGPYDPSIASVLSTANQRNHNPELTFDPSPFDDLQVFQSGDDLTLSPVVSSVILICSHKGDPDRVLDPLFDGHQIFFELGEFGGRLGQVDGNGLGKSRRAQEEGFQDNLLSAVMILFYLPSWTHCWRSHQDRGIASIVGAIRLPERSDSSDQRPT